MLLNVLLFPAIRNGLPLWNVKIVETVQPPASFSRIPSFSPPPACTEGQVVGAAHVNHMPPVGEGRRVGHHEVAVRELGVGGREVSSLSGDAVVLLRV